MTTTGQATDRPHPAPAMADTPAAPDGQASLRAAGLRVTAPRLAVLAAIEHDPHADADAIARAVRDRLGTVSRQAVYDVLHALTDAGIVRRIAVDERRGRFERHRHDNHHHLVCRLCGCIEDVPCVVGLAPCLQGAAPAGFEVDEAEVVFRGTCQACRATQPPAVA